MKISVIIPCYNVGKYLDRCLSSLEEQTVGIDELEIILVDDASTDDTREVISRWEQKYPENIIAVLLEVNGRQGRARNIGLSYASCDWIAFIDSDDWVERDYFEKLYDGAIENDCDLACCLEKEDTSKDLTWFEKTSEESGGDGELPFRIYESDSMINVRKMLFYNEISCCPVCKVVRKDILVDEHILFPEGIMYEDLPWGMILALSVKRAYLLQEELYHYYRNPDSTVMTKDAEHHIDLLTMHMILWEELRNRGFYDLYRDEIEYNFLYTCALGFLKMLNMRYSVPNYSHFRLMQTIVSERIPDPNHNLYIRNGDIIELHKAFIDLIYKDLNKKTFLELMESVRTAGL